MGGMASGGAGGMASGGMGGMGGMGGVGGSVDCHELTMATEAPQVESAVIAAPMPPTEFSAFPVTLNAGGPRVLVAERRWQPSGTAGETVTTRGTIDTTATSFDELLDVNGSSVEATWIPSTDGKTLTDSCPSMTDYATHISDKPLSFEKHQQGLYVSVELGNNEGFWRAYVDPTVAHHVLPLPGEAQIIDDTILTTAQPTATGGALTAGTYVLTEWNKFGGTGDTFAYIGFLQIDPAQSGTQRVWWTLFYGPHHHPGKSHSGYLDYNVATQTPGTEKGSLPSAVTFAPDAFSASSTGITLHAYADNIDYVFERLP
jgi:hypothetical protein